ncbi:Ni/Fe-hydrogenase cytochrome b subunit [candidate division LCP-89 bacterium B3_LCP]|uniref:Ni/Fe-hydrogenase cytochrome b subunit n=1 Tax=candidate division LCP-89 bacterium B3_LCP TaxID=2012998 RepID=A0A532UNS7_UNCL8|nr:MAG: Ni/Fe-hydrogenase cytochrome b subunit [candidate division LCP-89 bacterium B3_LCP]
MNRIYTFKTILWTILGFGAAVGTARFIYGLGVTTNLSDSVPWGLWIGFDVMGGVALAAGGFILTATVYIFRLEKFHGIVRPAVLTAFLGYIAVAVGLLFDLGLPWNIWHMIIFWNPHSPLFEVGWCVMLYLTVLLLEFFPIPAEEFSKLNKLRNFLLKLRLPLVIAGIALSTLHQSSLGSLFLIMPYNVHPLWYSPILPVLFFISAITLGLMMVSFESKFTSWLYRRETETDLLAKLCSAARWVFLIYIIVRFGDLAFRGQLGHLGGGEWQVVMFWVEIAITALIPVILLSIPKIRIAPVWQWIIPMMSIFGIVLNRINVGGLVHINRGNTLYLPSLTEITISASVVAGAALVFLYMVERYKIWEKRPADPNTDPTKIPEFDFASRTSLGTPEVALRTKYSLAFILAAAVGFALLSTENLSSAGTESSPAKEARGWETMWIDGDLDGEGTAFPHAKHIDNNGKEKSCVLCHHMNLPLDNSSQCSACHRDMYLLSDAFGHDRHASASGAGLKCFDCHKKDLTKNADTAKPCKDCHGDLVAEGSTITVENYRTIGYVESMHRLCIGCHSQKADSLEKPDLPRCANCHKEKRTIISPDAGVHPHQYGAEKDNVIFPIVSYNSEQPPDTTNTGSAVENSR